MAMGGNRGRRGLVSEINVTPLVDVMLVLLIIFMVTAPMMTQGVDVDLPETTARPLRQNEDPIIVAINKNGDIYINKTKVDQATLRQQLNAASGNDNEHAIFLKADRQVPYGLVIGVMSDIKDAGFAKLGMITRPADESR